MLAVFKLTTENITTLTSSGIHGTKRAATSSSSCSGRDAYNLLNVLLQQRHGATRHDAELKPGRELQRRRRPRAGAKPEIDAEAENGKHTVAAAPRARVTSPRPRLVPCLALTLTFDESYGEH